MNAAALLLAVCLPAAVAPAQGTTERAFQNLNIVPDERVELAVPSLGIPSGVYGSQQARAIWSRLRAFEHPALISTEEIALPNVPGKFKFLLAEFQSSGRTVWLRAILKKRGDAWVLQSVREVQGF